MRVCAWSEPRAEPTGKRNDVRMRKLGQRPYLTYCTVFKLVLRVLFVPCGRRRRPQGWCGGAAPLGQTPSSQIWVGLEGTEGQQAALKKNFFEA